MTSLSLSKHLSPHYTNCSIKLTVLHTQVQTIYFIFISYRYLMVLCGVLLPSLTGSPAVELILLP